jgi:hypothetical protein
MFIAPLAFLCSLWFDGCSRFRLSSGCRSVLGTTVVRRLNQELLEQHTPRVDHGHASPVRGIALALVLDVLAPRALGALSAILGRHGGGLLGLAFHRSSLPCLATITDEKVAATGHSSASASRSLPATSSVRVIARQTGVSVGTVQAHLAATRKASSK